MHNITLVEFANYSEAKDWCYANCERLDWYDIYYKGKVEFVFRLERDALMFKMIWG